MKLSERFWSKTTKHGDDGCWIWNASLVEGYGVFWFNGKLERAHRLTYEAKYGPVPAGMDLHHIVCETRKCINPDHVTPISKERHMRLTQSRLRCRKGHSLTGDNYDPKFKRCKTCIEEARVRYRERQR